jgi:hypothetical protein
VLTRLRPGARALAERDAALADRDRARSRARRLQTRVDALRTRDDLGYLFVVTYGRSGSTLLQGILDSIPGYLIRGENRQALRHLYDFQNVVLKERRAQRRQRRRQGLPPEGTTPAHAFFGMDGVSRQTVVDGVRRFALDTLLRPQPDTRVTGFKEIRWDEEDVAEYAAWLQEVFPGARFLVNTRSLDDVVHSKWWAERPDAREHLEAVEARLLALAEQLGDAAYRVHYDDYVRDPGVLEPLFAWLGEPYDEAAVRAVLDTPHSY